MRSCPATLLLLLLVPAGACDAGGPESDGVETVVDSAGDVVRIHNSGTAPELTLEPMFTVGGLADTEPGPGGTAEEFGAIRRVLLGPGGELLVADGHSDQVTIFDSTGSFLRTLGRRGAGPGEIEALQDMAWLGDTLVVMDSENGRLTRLTSTGEYVGEWPFMRASGTGVGMHNVGPAELNSFAIRFDRAAAGGGGATGGSTAVWARFDRTGPVDTVPQLRPPEALSDGSYAVCRGNGIGVYQNPLGETFLARPAGGGNQAVATSAAYRIAWIDPQGDTVRTLARDVDPVPLGEDEWSPIAESYAEWREAWRGADCEGSVERPTERRLLLGLHHDEQGRVIVEYEDAEGHALDFYDQEGRWAGRAPFVERDPGVDPAFRNGRAAVVRRDELDVQRVEVFRVVPVGYLRSQ